MDDAAKRRLLEIISKIPLFEGLTLYQAEKVLALCRPKKYEVDQVLFKQGTPSTEMFVLLSGELGIVRDNTVIATITPVAPVGEMGILTGESRTATVIAKVISSLLVIRRVELESMMKRDLDIAMGILKNFSQTLSQRLADTNAMLEKNRHQTQELKRQVIEYRRRVEILEQQAAELTQQVGTYKRRIEELEQEKAVVGSSVVGRQIAAKPSASSDREAVQQLIDRHLAMLKARDYQGAYGNLSTEAKRDVSWAEYEQVQKQVEELGVLQLMALETFELQREEDIEYYYVKYTVDFASASGILELYVQKENGEWKISHEIVTAAGKSHTV